PHRRSLRAPAVRRAALAAGLCALVLTAAAAFLGWAHNSRIAPRNGEHVVGNRSVALVFLLLLSVAFLAYAAGAWLVRRASPALMAVAAIACAMQLAPLAAPLLLSTDAWTYWDYGRIAAVHDANPYQHPPSHFPGDPAYPYVGVAWRGTTSVYGPAFTLASEPLAPLVKWVPLVLLPLRLVESRARRVGFGYLGLAGAAAVVLALGTWRYGLAWADALRPLTEHAERETAFALPHRLTQLGVPHDVSIALFAAAFGLAYLWLLRTAWRGRARL